MTHGPNEKPDRSKRSYRYQWKFKEVPLDTADLDRFTSSSAEDMKETEESKVIKEEIVQVLFTIADKILTDRQKEIFRLRFIDNLRQKEIADRLDITQGAVSLALNGIPNYTYKKKHGGILPKIRKYCMNSKNEDAQKVLGLLENLQA